MKAQLKMLIASVVVIALALTAISGITYSWFSDTDRSEVEFNTAKVSYDATYSLTDEKGEITTAIDGNKVTIGNLASGSSVTVNADIKNTSNIRTVYKIVAKPAIADNSTFTYYDLINVYINGKALTVDNLTTNEATVKDWTMVEVTSNVNYGITIHTPEDYGGTPEAPIKWYNPKSGEGSTTEIAEYKPWDNKTAKSGLTIEFSIIAVQGTYPYETVEDSTGNCSIDLPANRIIGYKYTGNIFDIKTATIDFSNVSKYTMSESSHSLNNGQKIMIGQVREGDSASTKTFLITVDDQSTSGIRFDQPVILTVQYGGVINDPVIRPYNSDESEPANVISSTVSNSETTIVFSITTNHRYVIEEPTKVTSSDELTSALSTNGKTVKLMADISLTTTITTNNYITLDLNGHTLGDDSSYAITNEGTLRIKDSSGVLGSIKGSTYAICNNATLTIDGGIFSSDSAVYNENGTVTINGGSFTSTGSNAIIVNKAESKGKITINGGEFKGKALLTGNVSGTDHFAKSEITISNGIWNGTEFKDYKSITVDGKYHFTKDSSGVWTYNSTSPASG